MNKPSLLLEKYSVVSFPSIERMSLKDLGIVKTVSPNVVCLQTSSIWGHPNRSSMAVAALGPAAALQ